ncbi:MAG: hypothetical protein ABI586_08280 [Candidatus Nanopelagicales bacterium]
MNNVLAVGGFSFVVILLLAIAEWLARRWRLEPELARKFAHVTCGLVAAALPFFMSFGSIAVLCLLFIPFMVISRQWGFFPAVHQAERSTLGDLYFPLGVLLVALAFPERAPYIYGVLVMTVSDAVAGIVGKRFGRRGYRLCGAWKTYVGSGAFFGTTLLLTLITLTVGSGSYSVALATAIGMAVALTIVEGALGGGVDNVVLPGVSASLLTLTT